MSYDHQVPACPRKRVKLTLSSYTAFLHGYYPLTNVSQSRLAIA